jgi:hypothetical protein
MQNRATIVFTAVMAFSFFLYALWRAEALPGQGEEGAKSARVRAAWTLDLETGDQGTPQADLHWGMEGPHLPYLAVRGGALIAQADGARWAALDEAALGRLEYAPGRYSAWGPEAPARTGAVFGVRTREGSLAKVRVKDISDKYVLRLEWVMYSVSPEKKAAGKDIAKPLPARPAPAWHARRDEALAAYRAQRNADAFEACREAVAAARPAGEAQLAAALVTCGGLIGLHREHPDQMEDWLRQAKAIAMKLDPQALLAALGPGEALLRQRALRTLGVFYRDRNRTLEAAENFALAVDAVRALPGPETPEQRLALRSDLYELGVALARLGYRGTARRALGEARDYYLRSEPDHPTLKAIDAELRRLEKG